MTDLDVRASPIWYPVLFASTAGLAGALTVLFRAMRSVMEIGGACGSGGAYAIARPCPAGIPLLTVGSILGGLAFAGVNVVASNKVKAPSLIWLAWPALFLSLGYNFWQFGLDPPGAAGVEGGWIACGIVFVIMGGIPLALGISLIIKPDASGAPSIRTRAVGLGASARAVTTPPVFRATGMPAQRFPSSGPITGPITGQVATVSPNATLIASAATEPAGMVSTLERLAELHRHGALTDAEFADAKRAVISGDRQPEFG